MCKSGGKRSAISKWRLSSRTAAFCLLAPLLVGQNLNVKSELALGIVAFNRAQFGDAILHLQRVVTADPNSVTGHFYLAEAYDKMYSEACERNCVANERRRQRSIEEFNRALELEPSLIEAMKAIARRCDRSANADEADHYYRRALQVDPNDFEALYNLAVLGWQRSYQLRMLKRGELKLGRKKPLIHSPSCGEVRNQNLARIEESIALLQRADTVLQSVDAHAYMELLYRERAEIQCDDPSAYARDSATALNWARRACDTRHGGARIITSGASSERLLPGPQAPARGEAGACRD